MAGKLGGSARVLLALWAFYAAAAVARADTLDEVRRRGFVVCGVNTGLAGFGLPDDKGTWRGFDIDYCRAVAAAIFDDPDNVKFIPLSGKDRFTALQSGEVDLLSRNTTWTQSREAGQGLLFTGINYFDGQGFLVRKSLGSRFGAKTQRRLDLRPAGHNDRAQSGRLFPRPRPEGRDGGVLDLRRGDQGL